MGYKGSGGYLGHGPRQAIANFFHLGKHASTLGEFLVHSLLQEDSVQITGKLLDGLKRDPAISRITNTLTENIQKDPNFGKKPVTYGNFFYPEVGGERNTTSKFWYIQPETLEVASNPLTWTLRHFTLGASITASTDKRVVVNYTAYDVANLRVEGDRSSAYDNAVNYLGHIWHDVLGANDKMEVNAFWISTP